MRALVIGYGSIGKRHINNLTSIRGTKVIVVTKRLGDQFLKKKNCILVTSIKQGIKMNPDFAIISNETHLHNKTALVLAKNGINLLIEKPLSHNLRGISNLLEIVKRKKLDNHEINKGDLVIMASVGAGMNVNAVTYRV